MKMIQKIKQSLLLLLFSITLVACTPTESVIQTAIVQTQTAAPTITPTERNIQELMQTSVAQTLTPAVAALSTSSAQQIEVSVMQTLTAIVPTATATPLISSTPTPLTPTVTSTHAPWPTITNTPEPYIPSGPITLTEVKNLGENRVRLSWQADGSFLNGFYVIWSSNEAEPAYPDSYWYYFSDGHIRSAEVEVKEAKTYYFRICEVDADHKNCASYSNVLQFAVQ